MLTGAGQTHLTLLLLRSLIGIYPLTMDYCVIIIIYDHFCKYNMITCNNLLTKSVSSSKNAKFFNFDGKNLSCTINIFIKEAMMRKLLALSILIWNFCFGKCFLKMKILICFAVLTYSGTVPVALKCLAKVGL